jgi:hypothetical protein
MSSFPKITADETREEYDARVNEYMRGVLEADERQNEKPDKSPQILVMGHEVNPNEPVAPQLHEWASLFHDKGYEYKVGYAQYFKPAANVRSHDKVMDVSYIEGAKRGRPKVHVAYERESGGKSWTNSGSYVYGREPMGLKDIQREVER